MKARIKITGEIVEVVITQRETHTGEQVYMTNDGRLIEESRLELNVDDDPDYWTRLEHQYAGMAMNALLLTNNIRNGDLEGMRECNTNAMAIAHALVKKMKEERK